MRGILVESLLCGTLIFAAGATSSCRYCDKAAEVSQLFDGFVYGAEASSQEAAIINFTGISVGWPRSIKPHQYYFFYHREPNDPVESGLHLLQVRMRAQGWRFPAAPKSIIDFEQPELGQARVAEEVRQGECEEPV
jgi:hypothetical protein